MNLLFAYTVYNLTALRYGIYDKPKEGGARGTGYAGKPLAPPRNHNDEYCLRRIDSKSLIPVTAYSGITRIERFHTVPLGQRERGKIPPPSLMITS